MFITLPFSKHALTYYLLPHEWYQQRTELSTFPGRADEWCIWEPPATDGSAICSAGTRAAVIGCELQEHKVTWWKYKTGLMGVNALVPEDSRLSLQRLDTQRTGWDWWLWSWCVGSLWVRMEGVWEQLCPDLTPHRGQQVRNLKRSVFIKNDGQVEGSLQYNFQVCVIFYFSLRILYF